MKKPIFIIITFFVLLGCKSQRNQTNKIISIDVNQKNSFQKDFLNIKIISINPLEKSDSALFGYISSTEYFENRLYILDIFSSKSLLVFSQDGKFINKTKFGRGPKEMLNPFAFSIDKNNHIVKVWDQALSTMFMYDLNLNFLSKSKYDNCYIQNFSIIDSSYSLVLSHFNKDYVFHLYNNNFDSIITNYIKDVAYDGVFGLQKPISNNNRVLLIAPLDYNIYKLSDYKIASEYYLDFGKYKLQKHDFTNKNIGIINKLIKSGQRVSSINGILETNNYLLFNILYKNESLFYVHSIKNGKTVRLNDYSDLGYLPKLSNVGTIDDNTFYALIDPIELNKFREKINRNIYKDKILYDYNPFLLIFTM